MVGEIMTGLSIFKSMLDAAKALKDINDATARNAAIIELQEKILTAQEQQSGLIQRVRDAEAKMAALETWQAEKDRYQLTDYGGGTYAYALKQEKAQGEPPHRLCVQCFEDGRKSVLHFMGHGEGQDHFRCHRCKLDLFFGLYRPSSNHRNPIDF
jgi:hypothetical protein